MRLKRGRLYHPKGNPMILLNLALLYAMVLMIGAALNIYMTSGSAPAWKYWALFTNMALVLAIVATREMAIRVLPDIEPKETIDPVLPTD